MAFHLYHITELYSNADGTVQFIELHGEANNQNLMTNHKITVVQGMTTNEYTFTNDLPSTLTNGKSILLATQGFADLGIVNPDYIIPDGFLFTAGGSTTVTFPSDALTNDIVNYMTLPTNGTSSYFPEGATTGSSTPTNFAGDTGSIPGNPIVGTSGNDSLEGGSGVDFIVGGAGNDTLDGLGGMDHLKGGLGDDYYVADLNITATALEDTVTEFFGQGTDTLEVVVGFSLMVPYTVDLGVGLVNIENLRLYDGAGTIDGVNWLLNGLGNALNNRIEGNAAANTLNGKAGNDVLIGGSGNDQLRGEDGNDVLNGGIGNDTMIGGIGNDTYVRNSASDVITESAGQGTDTVQSSIGYTLIANLENLTLTGAGNINGTGNGLNNVITGNTGANTLTGSGGNDTLNGGAGNDNMAGGIGNDTYVRDAAGDVVTELAGGGTDFVQSSVSYVLSAEVENLTLTGTGHINGTGNALLNVLTGNSGNNVLNGAGGNDVMAGGAGSDTYVRDSVGDSVTELAGQGNDLVQSSVTYTLGLNLERLTLTGTGHINGTGNGLANILTGNAGNNTLNGSGGADTLNGLGGNDTLIWDAADTQFDGGAGSDTLRINGTGQHLNLNLVPNNKILNVEIINITGSGNNALTVNLQDVLDLSSTTNTLRVDGNAGDSFQRGSGWTQGANQVIGANTYFSYTQGAATLLVDNDISAGT